MGRFGVKWVGRQVWIDFTKISVPNFSLPQTALTTLFAIIISGSVIFQQSTLPILPPPHQPILPQKTLDDPDETLEGILKGCL